MGSFVYREARIFCDRCGWNAETPEFESIRPAKATLRREGWKFTKTEDVCPKCVKKEAASVD